MTSESSCVMSSECNVRWVKRKDRYKLGVPRTACKTDCHLADTLIISVSDVHVA